MCPVILTALILLETFGVYNVHFDGLPNNEIPAMFTGNNTSDVSRANGVTEYRQSHSVNTGPGDRRYSFGTVTSGSNTAAVSYTNSNSIGNESEALFFWTPPSTIDDLIARSTGSNSSLFTTNGKKFDRDNDPNRNQTKNINWTMIDPTLHIINSELVIDLLDNTTQIISKNTAADLSFVFTYVLYPSLAVPGCVCNLLNMFVLRKQGFGESTTCYLFALSLADFFYLLFELQYFVFTVLRDHSYSAYVRWASGMHHDLLSNYFGILFGRISNYFVTVLSIERFIAVRFPLRVKFTPFTVHPKKVIVGVWLFVSVLLAPNIFSNEFVLVEDSVSNITTVTITSTEFYKLNKVFFTYYTYFLLASLRMFPVILVLILNGGIIAVLKRSQRNRVNMNADDHKRQRKQQKITRMLIAIAMIFLICVSPGLLHTLFTMFYRPYYADNPNLWGAFHDIFPLFDIINSTVNFLVYIMMSEKFRQIFFEVFCKRRY